MKTTSELENNSMQGNYFNQVLQQIDECIEKMYDGEKLKW